MAQIDIDAPSRRVTARVNAELRRQGLTKAAFARRLGRHHQWVSRRLWGEVPWTVEELEKAANVLDVSVTQLLEEKVIQPTLEEA